MTTFITNNKLVNNVKKNINFAPDDGLSGVSGVPSTYVDPWDIMNNFCFH